MGLGLPSIIHSNLIDSSFVIEPIGSGNWMKTGDPIIIKDIFISLLKVELVHTAESVFF